MRIGATGIISLESATDGGGHLAGIASGVLAEDGLFYVIFDNLPHIARIDPELSATADANRVIEQNQGHRRGFEDIAYDRWSGRFYVLINSPHRGHGTSMAMVQEYDASFRHLNSAWLDFPLDRLDKGLEGLTCVRRDGQTHLLGLCQDNRCEGAKEAPAAASQEAGGSTSSGWARSAGTGSARSSCRRPFCSGTTVA